jgi:hypothetical protein
MAEDTGLGPAEKPAIGGEFLVPAVAVGLAVYFLIDVDGLVWEARANATVIAYVLLGLIAIQLVRMTLRVYAGEASLGLGPLVEPRRLLPLRFMVVAVTGTFIIALPWLGLTLGLFLLVGILMTLLRAGTWTRILTTATVVSGLSYFLFIALLNSRLPHGPVEKLLAVMF